MKYLKYKLHLPLFSQQIEMMIAKSFEFLVKETLRLLDMQTAELNKALEVPHFLHEANSGRETIDAQKVRSWIDDIENEKQKLNRLEIVVAVVGTMKAGKSTTINAIAGMELMPNREMPMTTLPTLIRNKHGQSEPVLKIAKIKPLEELSRMVAEKVREIDLRPGELQKISLHGTPDGKALVEQLKSNDYQFKPEYKGQEEISNFLKHLNDIMRLAKDDVIGIDVDPIYQEYGNTDDLPVIEVEFCHLKGSEDLAQGSLAILDTPGPNEYGQSETLRDVFKTQLKKASAVFLVIDFTQMNSEAEAGVRQELDNVKNFFTADRLYVLVNKFDQANKNTMKEDEIRDFVMDKLLVDVPLNRDHIFPVASWRAYLANRARNHVAHHDEMLPAHDEEPWVKDFAKVAFGDDWEGELEDITPARLEKKINAVWDKSLFEQPIERVIKTAHASAAEKSIGSSVAKLVEYSREYLNVLNVRCRDMDNDIEKLQDAMRDLEADITRCREVERDVRSKSNSAMEKVKSDVDQLWEAQKQHLQKTINDFFQSGRQKTDQELKESLQKEIYHRTMSFREILAKTLSFGTIDRQKSEYDNRYKERKRDRFHKDSIEFTNQSEAKAFLNDIIDDIQNIFITAEGHVGNIIKELLYTSAGEIAGIVNNNVKETLERAKKRLDNKGIEIDFNINPISFDVASINPSQIFDSSFEEDRRTITRSCYKDGIWGDFCRWLGTSEWGKEDYKDTQISYKIHIHKIRDTTLKELSNMLNQFSNQTEYHLTKEFQPKIDEKLAELVGYLQRYHGVINDSLEDSKLEQKDKTQLKVALTGLRKQAIINKGDIDVVVQSVQRIN